MLFLSICHLILRAVDNDSDSDSDSERVTEMASWCQAAAGIESGSLNVCCVCVWLSNSS